MPPPNTTIFSQAEIEKMRLYVLEHDKHVAANVFDLNNPPRTNYTHQPWPKLMYSLDDEGKRIHMKVENAEAQDAALAQGWTNEPQAAAPPEEIELDAASAAEVEAFDKRLREVRKKKATKAGK